MPTSKPANHMSRTLLLVGDSKNTVLAEMAGRIHRLLAYSPYGQQSGQQKVMTHLGFNGELREAKTDWYFLGKGYRVYNPRLMRFHSPDKFSPFGKGGTSSYTYCGGDPANGVDPTGEASLFDIFAGFWAIISPVGRGGANAGRTTTVTTQSSTGGILGAMSGAMKNSQVPFLKSNKTTLGRSKPQQGLPKGENYPPIKGSTPGPPPTPSIDKTRATPAPISRSSINSSSSPGSRNSSLPSTPSSFRTISSFSSGSSGYESLPGTTNAAPTLDIEARLQNLRAP